MVNLYGTLSIPVGGGSGGEMYDFVQFATGSNFTVPYDFFRNQTNLKSYTGCNDRWSTVTIRGRAFMGCTNLEVVYLPWCERVDENAFDGCSNLKDLYIGSTAVSGVPTVVDVATTLANVERVHVPADMLDTYKAATGWKTIPDKLVGDYVR